MRCVYAEGEGGIRFEREILLNIAKTNCWRKTFDSINETNNFFRFSYFDSKLQTQKSIIKPSYISQIYNCSLNIHLFFYFFMNCNGIIMVS